MPRGRGGGADTGRGVPHLAPPLSRRGLSFQRPRIVSPTARFIGYALGVEAYALPIHDGFRSFDVYSAVEKPALAWMSTPSARRA